MALARVFDARGWTPQQYDALIANLLKIGVRLSYARIIETADKPSDKSPSTYADEALPTMEAIGQAVLESYATHPSDLKLFARLRLSVERIRFNNHFEPPMSIDNPKS